MTYSNWCARRAVVFSGISIGCMISLKQKGGFRAQKYFWTALRRCLTLVGRFPGIRGGFPCEVADGHTFEWGHHRAEIRVTGDLPTCQCSANVLQEKVLPNGHRCAARWKFSGLQRLRSRPDQIQVL